MFHTTDIPPNEEAFTGSFRDHKDMGRSKVTNGRQMLPNVDGRLRITRRFRDIANAIAQDQGGVDRISEVRHQVIRRFAAAACLAEAREARMARGDSSGMRCSAPTFRTTDVRRTGRVATGRRHVLA
jgi:hypothetical protein